jgi:hypothetical protein
MASVQKLRLLEKAAAAADQTGAAQSLLPKSGNFIGVIRTVNQNGATTVTAKIQHSPDGTNWADYIAFTAINATSGFEVKHPTNQPILPHVRAIATVTGATKLADIYVDLFFDPVVR